MGPLYDARHLHWNPSWGRIIDNNWDIKERLNAQLLVKTRQPEKSLVSG
jgi:hypothetical protein